MKLQGMSGKSVQWGAWAGSGMAAGDQAVLRAVERQGMGLVQPTQGLLALSSIFATQSLPAVLAAVPFNWNKLAQQKHQTGKAPSLLTASIPVIAPHLLASQAAAFAEPLASAHGSGQVPLAGCDFAQLSITIQSQAAEIAAGILGREIGMEEPLMAAGLDSLASVEFRNALEGKLAVSLPATLIFDHPTVGSIGTFVARLLPATAMAAAAVAPVVDGYSAISDFAPIVASSTSTATPVAVDMAAHQQHVSSVVFLAAKDIVGNELTVEQPLMAAGLDSLGAVELRNSLQGQLGVELPSTLVFDYPTVDSMAQYIARKLQPAAVQSSIMMGSSALADVAMSRGVQAAGLLVCSIASRSPKGVMRKDLAAVDAASVVPLHRWDLHEQEASLGTAPIRFAIFLDNVSDFDPSTFSVSENEAALMDPQQRLLLECSGEVMMQNMNLSSATLTAAGVFVVSRSCKTKY
jgi:acyl carrier protein